MEIFKNVCDNIGDFRFRVFYTISGDNFSIDRETGKIRLRDALDREAVDMLDVVITIQVSMSPAKLT